jgi:capsular polysaccharide biosynthesis protein
MSPVTADVAALPGGRLVSEHGFVVTHDDLLAAESAWDDDKLEASGVLRMHRLPRARVIDGAHASLMSQWCSVYYHWITDALPRLRILELGGCADVSLLVPRALTRWQRRSLELLGVGERCLVPYNGRHLRAETLIWPRPAATTGHTPSWACAWLRDAFAGSRRHAGRRLYLTRRRERQRRVANEHQVASLLSSRGFETVDPGALSLDEQVEMFTDAAVIISPHGGALTNILFSADATVIELFEPGYVNPCFYVLADRSGHRYWYLLGRTAGRRDIEVDRAQLGETLTAAGV